MQYRHHYHAYLLNDMDQWVLVRPSELCDYHPLAGLYRIEGERQWSSSTMLECRLCNVKSSIPMHPEKMWLSLKKLGNIFLVSKCWNSGWGVMK